ncbi:unnamed protein product [Withania somnifera]
MGNKIKQFQEKLELEVCSDFPNALRERKHHVIELPYINEFNENIIPTKARPIQMNHELMETCKKEINDLLSKKIIRPSKSPWSCSAFYVNNAAEKERGAPSIKLPSMCHSADMNGISCLSVLRMHLRISKYHEQYF